MSEEKQYPSLVQQGKNLANFTWDLLNYITKNQEKVLFVSDEIYKERTTICKSCNKFDDLENRCMECGCYIPAKAKLILDSCPLEKWGVDSSTWEERFSNIETDMGLTEPPKTE